MTSLTLSDETLITRKDSIVGADASDDAILLDIDSGYFFQLNKSAARVWHLLESPMPFAELCAVMQKNFTVDAVDCRADVGEFVTDMSERGIVTVG